MKSILSTMVLIGSICLSGDGAQATDQQLFHNGLSMQGVTGILNTPSAHVTREGDLYALYSNQKESKWRNRTHLQDNYFFAVGLFNFAEISGTFFEAPHVGRDLSASVKITSEPFFHDYKYAPVLAFGIQDISGGASYLKTKYAVISEDIWRLRLSAGYGTGPDRMKGGFAGAEFKAQDWLYLLADYDTKETNVGVRAVLPQFWKIPISLTATAKTSLDYHPGNFDIAVGFSLPLDFNMRKKTPDFVDTGAKVTQKEQTISKVEVKRTDLSNESGTQQQELKISDTANQTSTSNIQIPKTSSSLETLRNHLVKTGFMNVRVGDANNFTAVIEYENVIFNHNELDALGVIIGTAVSDLKDTKFENIRIIIKKKNLAMLQISLPLEEVAYFLENGSNLDSFKNRVVINNSITEDTSTNFSNGDENSSFLSTSFVLWPGLSTIIGSSESGEKPFEYRLSLKPDLYVNLWKGGLLNARWDIPVSWSDKMDDGKMDSVMERVMITQGIKLLPNVMANLGAGMIMHDQYGTTNELIWQPLDGSHRVRLAHTWTENSNSHQNMESFLASYRYYFSPLDISLEGTIGKFWYQDRGFTLELKRFFGDTTFSLYYKNSTTTDSKHWQAVGVQFAFPLTPEKDMKHYYKMQVRGTEEWNYAQETTLKNANRIDKRGEKNYLPDVPLAVAPVLTSSLHNQYLNRDRLNESYILSHLERLRTAWIKYKDQVK